MTLPAPSVSCLKFVFDALVASPRAADMGRGESCLGGEDVIVTSRLLIFAGGRDAPFRVSAHPGLAFPSVLMEMSCERPRGWDLATLW